MWAHASASSPPAMLSLQSKHGARRFGAGLLSNRACDRRGEVMRYLVAAIIFSVFYLLRALFVAGQPETLGCDTARDLLGWLACAARWIG